MNPVPILPDHKPETLNQQIRWLAQERAEATAIVLIEGERHTRICYRDFFEQAAHYASALEAAGVRRGDIVVLILQHGEAVLHAFWGAMLAGAVPSIFSFLSDKLDPARYFNSVREMIAHAEARTVITYTEIEAALRPHLEALGHAVTVLDVDHLKPSEQRDIVSWNEPDADDTAFLQHSSGSTGLQKGVMLSHKAVINQIASYSEAIQLSSEDVVVSWLPLYHDMGLIAGFITPIMQGVPLVLMSPFQWVRDPKLLLKAIQQYGGTLCWLPNFAYNLMTLQIRERDLEGLDLSSLRAVINCSEPVYAASHDMFLERYRKYGLRAEALAVCYAMAENTFAVTQSAVGEAPKLDTIDKRVLAEAHQAVPAAEGTASVTLVSCGRPISNCEVRVVDGQRMSIAEREVGEIAIRSDSMLAGYYRRPDATAEALADGWYYTGDLGYLADGELYITGRKKDLMIVGGKNVYPQDIEMLLNDIPGVHAGRAVAFGVFNERLATEDIAVVAEVDTDDEAARSEIEQAIRGRVAQSTDVTARYVHLVEAKWLVKTSSGKVARQANREKFVTTVLNG
jgi:fatty-acyl-CoA synthase